MIDSAHAQTIGIDALLKLDFNRTISELRVENDILKRRLEVMEKHIHVRASNEVDGGGEGHKLGGRNGNQIEQLTRAVRIYKKKTVCLKQLLDTITVQHNQENQYLQSQVTFLVEKLKTCDKKISKLRTQLDKIQTAYEKQQMKVVACFTCLQQIKTRYEDKLEKQRIFIQMLDARFKSYFTAHVEGLNRPQDNRESQLVEHWGLQEKIEYLELKCIDEKRDKIFNRLLFENKQLRRLVETDFIQNAETCFRKRIKRGEKEDAVRVKTFINEIEKLDDGEKLNSDVGQNSDTTDKCTHDRSCNVPYENRNKDDHKDSKCDSVPDETILSQSTTIKVKAIEELNTKLNETDKEKINSSEPEGHAGFDRFEETSSC